MEYSSEICTDNEVRLHSLGLYDFSDICTDNKYFHDSSKLVPRINIFQKFVPIIKCASTPSGFMSPIILAAPIYIHTYIHTYTHTYIYVHN